ncbi:MAG: hypothetical protein O3A82_02055 [Verrucomicrobia bacterium]|nr:hypothetical protein [Verrucomicrobiota bacterium]MDA0724910.1 hypothetical protein [Verrucomicrobiota bacterium]MDA1045694.1 hypothetical protein [Verrucomicrobiota bacterium]
MIESIIQWSNENEGFLSLLSLFIGAPILFLLFRVYRKIKPSEKELRESAIESFDHATKLFNEIKDFAERQDFNSHLGEFILRDVLRKMPNTDEQHSREDSPYTIAALIDYHRDYLEFRLDGVAGPVFIRKEADTWVYCDRGDDDAVMTHLIGRIAYSSIDRIRWEADEYWEWPQICCHFKEKNRFPYIRLYYAEEKKSHRDESFFVSVCDKKDLTETTWEKA